MVTASAMPLLRAVLPMAAFAPAGFARRAARARGGFVLRLRQAIAVLLHRLNVFVHALEHALLSLGEAGRRLSRVSGRLAFELVQKAALAGAPILVGVGAPTSLAVQLADEVGMTLCGFARQGRLNVYTGADRVA